MCFLDVIASGQRGACPEPASPDHTKHIGQQALQVPPEKRITALPAPVRGGSRTIKSGFFVHRAVFRIVARPVVALRIISPQKILGSRDDRFHVRRNILHEVRRGMYVTPLQLKCDENLSAKGTENNPHAGIEVERDVTARIPGYDRDQFVDQIAVHLKESSGADLIFVVLCLIAN